MSIAPSPDRPTAGAVRAMQESLRALGDRADPIEVVRAHIAAVQCGNPEQMAADYSAEARITRGSDVVVPLPYFRMAIGRLGDSRLFVASLTRTPQNPADPPGTTRIVMEWELQGGPAAGTRGTDTFFVRGCHIVAQQVVLHTADYH